jgi:hypothetical protein
MRDKSSTMMNIIGGEHETNTFRLRGETEKSPDPERLLSVE